MATASDARPVPHVVRRGAGVPLLLVHGNGVDHRILLELDEVLADGWERLYVDLPGFGRTPGLPGRGGLSDLLDWLDGWVEDVVGRAPFAVVGNSMGGLLAAHLAARRGAQCLGAALLAPVVQTRHDLRTLPTAEVTRDPELLAGLDPADADEYAAVAVDQGPESWARFRRAVLPGLRAGDPQAMRRLGAAYELPAPDAAGLTGPTLVVTGRQDTIVGFADQWAWADGLARGTFAALDRAGHNVHLDQPATVAALLTAWAERVRAR